MGLVQKSSAAGRAAHADYGFDAPKVPIYLTLGGLVAMIAAGVSWTLGWGLGSVIWFLLVGLANLTSAGLYVYATRRGKHQAWAEILDSAGWQGDESVLDMGCGRGAVLIAAAKRLPRGHAIGVDIWDVADQSGNSLQVARRNSELEGVTDRVEPQTADIRELPFDSGTFDAVLSSLVLHNIHSADERRRVLDKAVQVLRPGGKVMIADIMHLPEYRRALEGLGLKDVKVRELGVRAWYGNPFMRTRLVSGVKPPVAGLDVARAS